MQQQAKLINTANFCPIFVVKLFSRVNMQIKNTNYQLLWVAIGLCILLHGTLVWTTLENTYDAYVHIFFAEHYAHHWFEFWNPKWYTGFIMSSYPPLVHQCTAILSTFMNLKAAFGTFAVMITVGITIGMFRFAKLWVDEKSASYAALYIVFSSCIMETLHIFGQVPTLTGLCFLLNALPDMYKWLRTGKIRYALMGISLMGVVSAAHHVTTIFGMVFFIAPVCGLAFLDAAREEDTHPGWKVYYTTLIKLLPRLIILGGGMITLLVTIIFPYWYNSKMDPITQVSIPHGSRDSFFEEPNSGLAFFVIPLGIALWLLPYLARRVVNRRNFFIGISFLLMILLGTGGTTPIPKMLLGANAFNILTLDRFSFWAAIIGCVFIGEYLSKTKNKIAWAIPIIVIVISIANMSKFRPMQPKKIDMQPIVSFLSQDQHDRWRYLTLGFGDQMAWLGALSTAYSVDGNYHSARRLPELTIRAVERLENAKYMGIEGLGALHQFLINSEKFHLKYIFSNDKFYEPLLYFTGWERVQRLENGIMLWQKPDVSPMPPYVQKKVFPAYQVWMWGILPILMLTVGLTIQSYFRILKPYQWKEIPDIDPMIVSFRFRLFYYFWAATICLSSLWWAYKVLNEDEQGTPEATLTHYYDAIDFKYFDIAHSYFDPQSHLSLAQYNLNRSVEDGIVASYAKLNGIYPTIKRINDSIVTADVRNVWTTALENYETFYSYKLIKRKKKWYIIPPNEKVVTPDDVLVAKNTTVYNNNGRRENTLGFTKHEDILDRPELQILQAHLVQNDTMIAIVGELQNTDVNPSYITIEGSIFSKNEEQIGRSTAGMTLKHKILPKETTAFRIDMEIKKGAKIADIATFTVAARGVVNDCDLNKDAVTKDVQVVGDSIMGQIYNNGTEEMSVPQLLFVYHDEKEQIIWVADKYLRESIKPERNRMFAFRYEDMANIKILQTASPNQLSINGMPQSYFHEILRENDASTHPKLYKLRHGFCQLQTNMFIASPTIY